jgi:hypothetical protein
MAGPVVAAIEAPIKAISLLATANSAAPFDDNIGTATPHKARER